MEDNMDSFPKKEKFNRTEKFKVVKPFTLDKFYRANSVFESSDREVIKRLLDDKYIK